MKNILDLPSYYNRIFSPSFINAVNGDIRKLNERIDAYNRASGENKRNYLRKILIQKQAIENKYSDNFFSTCREFSKVIQVDLFTQIQDECVKCGISDVYALSNPNPPINDFSRLLSNMSPAKLAGLTQILFEGALYNRRALAALYQDGDAGYEEFYNFLTNNSISFLGGGNSKNFKIIPNDGSDPYVVKLEDRMGMPMGPVVHLRRSLPDKTFSPVFAERQNTVTLKNNKVITRRILTTPFYSGSNLMAHSFKQPNESARTESAINIYAQMLSTLKNISNAGCAFPDMKNYNWLVDSRGNLVIADTKAFVFCKKKGICKAVLQTEYLNPPEFESKTLFSSDKMHAYMFGKNLYEYLTGCGYLYLHENHDAISWKFDYPIFQTPEGRELKQLIIDSVKPDPSKRISVDDALKRIRDLRNGQAMINFSRNESFINYLAVDFSLQTSRAAINKHKKQLLKEVEAYHKSMKRACRVLGNHYLQMADAQYKAKKESIVTCAREQERKVRSNKHARGCIQLAKRKITGMRIDFIQQLSMQGINSDEKRLLEELEEHYNVIKNNCRLLERNPDLDSTEYSQKKAAIKHKAQHARQALMKTVDIPFTFAGTQYEISFANEPATLASFKKKIVDILKTNHPGFNPDFLDTLTDSEGIVYDSDEDVLDLAEVIIGESEAPVLQIGLTREARETIELRVTEAINTIRDMNMSVDFEAKSSIDDVNTHLDEVCYLTGGILDALVEDYKLLNQSPDSLEMEIERKLEEIESAAFNKIEQLKMMSAKNMFPFIAGKSGLSMFAKTGSEKNQRLGYLEEQPVEKMMANMSY